ncbi:MAG: phospholipid carrier-dependent glycosyltransferase [Chloroflexi bacterium]|nr:MAG: phospholipid carrier-dependent glycosyltransferase [Chloroflexota bacterium]
MGSSLLRQEPQTPMRWWEWGLLILLLSVFVAQAGLSSVRKTAAFDEEYHAAAGYAYLKTGDFRMSTSHPPLIDALSAIPLLWQDDINFPQDHPSWAENNYFIFSDVFLWQAGNDPQRILVWSRWPIIGLGALLSAALFFWARQLAGSLAGWIALLLATFDPNLLNNARLVTTDLGLTLFMLLTMWALWGWWKRPSPLTFTLTGILGGLTTATKFTGLMVWPMIGLILLVGNLIQRDKGTKGQREEKKNISAFFRVLPRPIIITIGMGLVGYLALWAVYGFDVGPVENANLPISIPAPHYLYSALDTFRVIEEQPKTSYLLGEISPRGWWYYFPIALAVKTPLPLLILALIGGFLLIRKRRGWEKPALSAAEVAVILIPPTLFLALAMTGRITIGYRHILPVVPFLILIAAHVSKFITKKQRKKGTKPVQLVIFALLMWQIISIVWIFPNQESYFNELAGGPAGGDRFLVDSNIDWGQDLILLREVMDEKGIEEVYLSYFGTGLPEAYGVNYRPIPGFLRHTTGIEIDAYNPYSPPPGWYAISVTSLHLGLLEQNVDMFAYFRDLEPDARAGFSINLYHVAYPDDMPVERVVVKNGRSVSDTPLTDLTTPDTRLIVKWTRNPNVEIWSKETAVFPSTLQNTTANFANAFHLIGYDMPQTDWQPGDLLTATLYWQIGSDAIDMPAPASAPPLATFVHVTPTDAPQPIAQFDGWDVALAGLEPGDVIAQPIAIQLPEGIKGGHNLNLGLYSPQSNQRLPLIDQSTDFITLQTIQIK